MAFAFPISSCMLCSVALLLTLQYRVLAQQPVDPTKGFTPQTLNDASFVVQKPYDKRVDQRYSFIDGVHKLWVYSNDKSYSTDSNTLPRTEVRIYGYGNDKNYISGIWQFEAYGYVPSKTTGVSVMQILGENDATMQLRVYDGNLTYFRRPVLATSIYDRWFKLNVIHDVEANTVKIFIDGVKKYEGSVAGDEGHFFKFGVYTQNDASSYMESRWKNVRGLKK